MTDPISEPFEPDSRWVPLRAGWITAAGGPSQARLLAWRGRGATDVLTLQRADEMQAWIPGLCQEQGLGWIHLPLSGRRMDAETASHDNCPDCAAGESCSVSLCPSADHVSDGPVNAEFVGAVTCALEALRDGQPGRIRWTDSDGVGIFETYGYLELFGDGSARRGTSYIADFCYSESDHIEFGQLQLAMYFTDCLAEPDIMVRCKCIEGALATPTTVCQVGTKACVEG